MKRASKGLASGGSRGNSSKKSSSLADRYRNNIDFLEGNGDSSSVGDSFDGVYPEQTPMRKWVDWVIDYHMITNKKTQTPVNMGDF